GAARVRERQLEIVASAEPTHVQVGGRAQHLRVVGVERERARVSRARLVETPQLRQRGAAEVVRSDALWIDAPRFAGAFESRLIAPLLEVARGLLEQVRDGRV